MEVETSRLFVREFIPGDAPFLFALYSNPEAARFQTWSIMKDESEAAKDVRRYMGDKNENPRLYFSLAVILKEGELFVGSIGADLDSETSKLNLWYSFLPEFHGKGYATEAVKALISILPRGHVFEIECDPRNIPSRKLAERLGFKEVRFVEKDFKCKGEWVGTVTYSSSVQT